MHATDSSSEGRVLTPGDPEYAPEVAGFQTGFALRPARVWAARSAREVAEAVGYAAGEGLPLGVQATGHGLPDAAEGGVLVSTRRMDAVRIDPGARTAVIGAGARWGQVVEAAAPYGLAPLNGSSPGVGAVSYTLSGGLGILAREFGYAADRVRRLEVVTADGRLREVAAGSEPELFWGLRGGGHGLGVVTELEIGLVPVARLYGGALTFDASAVDPARILAEYEAWTRTVPENLTSSLAAVPYPDLPALPPHLRGAYLISLRVAFTGGAEEGERLVAPLRRIGPAVTDTLREMPYAQSPSIHNDPASPHAYYGDSAVLSELDVKAAAELLAATGPAAPMMCVVQLNHLGGALSREPEPPNAVPHREGRFLVRVLAVLDGTDRAAARAHFAGALAPLAPATTGRFLGFAFGGGDRGEGLYPAATRERLAALKRTYDPGNLFGGPHGGQD
ncbi:FAD-dependent oxygenase [Streptomyces albus]|uniref:FAD-dependent oxygenase n=1 Tax=Streptomyces albus (strain ATCC 21838 / DSM 41398 / FERM P-419 / JCM 4703 / NBRC 107858) TaxID=1081613 RepID=A0A0B5F5I5_STRA4|nr:FAD-dependent oxygenase [Streptomyces albus]AOU79934.1 FAD-dependent oxygenase [Streptomyces albus]AYN35650.1 FAD-binding oxidoreductase [Streptomyces albus]